MGKKSKCSCDSQCTISTTAYGFGDRLDSHKIGTRYRWGSSTCPALLPLLLELVDKQVNKITVRGNQLPCLNSNHTGSA